MRILNSRVV